jgi:hypothetical protein
MDTGIRMALIPEYPSKIGGRLGRHIHFDERSRNYRVPVTSSATIVTRTWARTVKPFDQGNLGSCTGNGAAGALATAPLFVKGKTYNEALAVKIYSRATVDDSIVGTYPPTDTGSTVLAAMKACKDLKLASGYNWCFSLNDVLLTLSTIGPVDVGVNWYSGFDNPTAAGKVKISGSVRGGHSFEILGVDTKAKTVLAENSWGASWGLAGRFIFSWANLERLLSEQGEAASIVAAA